MWNIDDPISRINDREKLLYKLIISSLLNRKILYGMQNTDLKSFIWSLCIL